MSGLRTKRAAAAALSALALASVALVACGDDDDTAATTTTAAAAVSPQDFSERGPHAVGAVRLQLDDQRPVEVLYPADPDAVPEDAEGYRYTPEEVWGPLLAALPAGVVDTVAVPDAWFDIPAADGVFPVVVISHGLAMMRFSYSFHAAHLASWGFVVASPEHPTRDLAARLGQRDTSASDAATIEDTVALLEAESSRAGSVLEGRVDTDQVAVEGHSAGGRDGALAAYGDVVDTWIGLAPAVPMPDDAMAGHDGLQESEDGFDPAAGELDLAAYLSTATPPDTPSMLLVSDEDIFIPVDQNRAIFDWLAPPKRFVVLAGTGHFSFVDACEGTQASGGSAIAEALGFAPESIERRYLENGCLPDDTPAEDVWAAWGHLAVAQLDWVFGIDTDVAEASLDGEYLDATFPGVIAEYLVEE